MADASNTDIPLADDDTTEEVTEADILKLSLGSGNKIDSLRASVQANTTEDNKSINGIDSILFSLPYGSNSSNSPAQPSCMLVFFSFCLFFNFVA